jgi:Ca-activated chloride channel family protein
MKFDQDYYAVLQIPSNADERAIKRAYRQLARRYHPDVSVEEQAADNFLQIQKAYECLVDPVQREAHDQWRRRQGLERACPLSLRITLSQQVLPCLGESQALYVLADLSPSADFEGGKIPINLCLVLDCSTSMKGARLHQVKEAARYIVDQMGPDDILSIVTFSDRAQLVLAGRLDIDRIAARAAISSIRSGGGTEIYQGLAAGLREVERWHSVGRLSHLILLTDGQTYGDEAACLEAARSAGEHGIPITTMGVGSDWNDRLLDEMASLSKASGSSIYVDSTSKIAKVFHDQIHGLGNIYAHNLSLVVHQSQGVSLQDTYRVSPSINELTMTDGRVSLGSLERWHPQSVILAFLVASHGPGMHRLVQIEAEGIVPAFSDQPLQVRREVEVEFVADLGQRPTIPPDIISALGRLTVVKMQERALHELEAGKIDAAVARLKNIATRLLDLGETELARAALLEAGRVAQTGSFSPEGRKKLRYGTQELGIVPKEIHDDQVPFLR